ncbi:MAG: transcriptional regulator, partial [Acetatifactor sp.]|nr:transcriptional regulator [Acetatifactor sp.]
MSVNELLAGERVAEDEYRKKSEENMVNLVKEAQERQKKIILSAMVAGLATVAAVTLFIISGALVMETWLRFILIGIGVFIIIAGIAIACILDRDAGAFECPECHERFVPEMRAYIMGPHTITKRKLHCPKCGSTKYCKHVLTKRK